MARPLVMLILVFAHGVCGACTPTSSLACVSTVAEFTSAMSNGAISDVVFMDAGSPYTLTGQTDIQKNVRLSLPALLPDCRAHPATTAAVLR
jgi:hypothetical protein